MHARLGDIYAHAVGVRVCVWGWGEGGGDLQHDPQSMVSHSLGGSRALSNGDLVRPHLHRTNTVQ